MGPKAVLCLIYRVSFAFASKFDGAEVRRQYVGCAPNLAERKREHVRRPVAWMKLAVQQGRQLTCVELPFQPSEEMWKRTRRGCRDCFVACKRRYPETWRAPAGEQFWEELRRFVDVAVEYGFDSVRGACFCLPGAPATWPREGQSFQALLFLTDSWKAACGAQDHLMEEAALHYCVVARHVAGRCLTCGDRGHFVKDCRRGWQAQSVEEKREARDTVEARRQARKAAADAAKTKAAEAEAQKAKASAKAKAWAAERAAKKAAEDAAKKKAAEDAAEKKAADNAAKKEAAAARAQALADARVYWAKVAEAEEKERARKREAYLAREKDRLSKRKRTHEPAREDRSGEYDLKTPAQRKRQAVTNKALRKKNRDGKAAAGE